MYGSGRRTALGGTSRDLRDPGRRMLGEPRGHPAWILLLCWSLATCCTGESMTVSCEALSGLPEFTLLYWLENGFFVESLHPDGAVHEGTVQEELQGSGLALHRDLHFRSFDSQHLHTNFTCVVLSPLGVDTREVQWPSPALAPVTGKSGGLG
ncbi:interleukin-18-binding protein isoform X2 [Chamaea fasciata]|uniref:interleukin-18-binding protein isoform X2 n=1 Tax=Chamaea fasciata TaxID=190680 RepID=UPI00336A5CC9